jgi:hypothetical protein
MRRHVAPAFLAAALVLDTSATSLRAEAVGPALTPKLLTALREEMRQVLGASQDILAALVIGDHAGVAERSQKIHDSFILEQALSEQDRKDLETAVPPMFLELDAAFHRTAADLVAAARAQDAGREAALFGQMIAACADCHDRFADDRFPGLGR